MIHIDNLKLLILENSIGFAHIGLFTFAYLSNFSYISWGMISLSKNINISNQCYQIWWYDFVGILYTILYIIVGGYTFAITLKNAKNMSDMTKINDSSYFDYIFIPMLLIWGAYIICTIDDDCLNLYLSGHKDIWDLCQGTFYGILSIVLIFAFFAVYIFIAKLYNYAMWNTFNCESLTNKKIINNFNQIYKSDEDNYQLLQNNE